MTTPDETRIQNILRRARESFENGLASGAIQQWADAEDLGRLHLQAAAGHGLDVAQSHGILRLTGGGVHGHSLAMDSAGIVLSNFQRLVTAAGAAAEGHTSSKGRIPSDISTKTRLALTASPGAGSVVLEFEPETDESRERYPRGQVPLEGRDLSLAERSVTAVIDILDCAAAPDPVAGRVVSIFTKLGTRTASAARAFAETAAGASLDVNLSWQVPGTSRRRVAVSATQSAWLSTVLGGQGLDAESDVLRGVLRTISDLRKIDLEIDDPEIQGAKKTIAVSRNPHLDLTDFNLGNKVRMFVEVRVKSRPGGAESRHYTAMTIDHDTAADF